MSRLKDSTDTVESARDVLEKSMAKITDNDIQHNPGPNFKALQPIPPKRRPERQYSRQASETSISRVDIPLRVLGGLKDSVSPDATPRLLRADTTDISTEPPSGSTSRDIVHTQELSHQHSEMELLFQFNKHRATKSISVMGTMRRGNQEQEVRLEMSEDAFARITQDTAESDTQIKKCSCQSGPHILLITVLFWPVAFLFSFVMTMHTGTICWYNVFLYVTEEKTFLHMLFLGPLIVLLYPIFLPLMVLVVGFYFACDQICWHLRKWCVAVKDHDKNVFGWICGKLGIPQCAPFVVIVIDAGAQVAVDPTRSEL